MYTVTFFVLFCLFWKLPLISDDFEFADLVRTKSFREIANYILFYGNGRFLGNTLSIMLVNANVVVSAAIKAIAVLGITVLLPRVLNIRSISGFLLSFVLILGVAPQIYAQVFVWTSGFVNFTFSVFLSLLCVYLIESSNGQSVVRKTLLTVLGTACQLFVEHVSIINIIVAVIMVWYFYRRDIVKRDAALAWLAGCMLGAVLMLMLPHIFYLEENRTQGYREVHTDSITSMFRSIINSLRLMIVTLSRCTLLFFVTSCFGWLIHRKSHNRYCFFARAVYLMFPVVSMLFSIREGIWIPAIVRYGAIYGGMLVYCLVLAIDVLKIADKNTKTFLIRLVFLAVLSAAPFLIVTPFGERCLFLAYSFLAMFAIKALFYAVSYHQIRFFKGIWLLAVCSIILSVFLCLETINVRKWNTARNDYIEACMASGKESICIYEIPSAYYFQTCLIDRWYYYESWHDISFEILEYDAWLRQAYP